MSIGAAESLSLVILPIMGMTVSWTSIKKLYESTKYSVFPALGNHDYMNNVDDTFENRCATRMVEYLIDMVGGMVVKITAESLIRMSQNMTSKVLGINFDKNEDKSPVKKTITGSLSYSWDIGNIHYVNLNNYPGYQKSWSNFRSDRAKRVTVNIQPSWEWLEKDLHFARKQGKSIILAIHDMMEYWTNPDADKFWEICKRFSVSGIFCGHDHVHGDRTGPYISPNPRLSCPGIPIFNCGSSDFNKYLYAWVTLCDSNSPFGDPLDTLNIKAVDSTPKKIQNPLEIIQVLKGTWKILPETWLVPLRRPSEVSILNLSCYMTRYALSYSYSSGGHISDFKSGEQHPTNSYVFDRIPHDATNLHLRIEYLDLKDKIWKDIMSQDINHPQGRTCYYNMVGLLPICPPVWSLEQ
jgi:cytolysin (calcineurin-like family phosphatase)